VASPASRTERRHRRCPALPRLRSARRPPCVCALW
jgi:hypothetical protein